MSVLPRWHIIRGYRDRNKKASVPIYGTKACNFCDTTQIDIPFGNVHSLHVPSYVPRWITGGVPSASTGTRSKPPLEVHSPTASCSDHTIRNSLKIRCLSATTLPHRFFKYDFIDIICMYTIFVKWFFEKFVFHIYLPVSSNGLHLVCPAAGAVL